MIDPFHKTRTTFERLASRRLLTHAIPHDGGERDALLYVPRHVSRRGGLPLVLVFHGGASSPESIARKSAMHKLAETEGFIVAYPRGTPGASGLSWNPAGSKAARKVEDVRFVRALLADLERHYEIDPRRVFAVGFSIGGSLVYELACVLSDRIAAMAIVAGTMTTGFCVPSRPVPLLHIHGTRDRRVPLEGGRGAGTRRVGDWKPVREGIERWRAINGCEGVRTVTDEPGVTGSVSSGVADVELWLVEGGGHTWPGGMHKREGSANADVAAFPATEKIWAFLSARPLGRRAALPAMEVRPHSR